MLIFISDLVHTLKKELTKYGFQAEVFSGKRNLTVKMIIPLHEHLNIPTDTLLGVGRVVSGVKNGERAQVLLGVTGSGKKILPKSGIKFYF